MTIPSLEISFSGVGKPMTSIVLNHACLPLHDAVFANGGANTTPHASLAAIGSTQLFPMMIAPQCTQPYMPAKDNSRCAYAPGSL